MGLALEAERRLYMYIAIRIPSEFWMRDTPSWVFTSKFKTVHYYIHAFKKVKHSHSTAQHDTCPNGRHANE